jgi:hypothetical protein
MKRRGRSEQAQVFQDIVRSDPDRFDLPDLKFRELVFIGALRKTREDGVFERDATRPMPLFREPDLIPEGARFRVERRDGRAFFERL